MATNSNQKNKCKLWSNKLYQRVYYVKKDQHLEWMTLSRVSESSHSYSYVKSQHAVHYGYFSEVREWVIELENVAIAEDAPEAVLIREVGADRRRGFKEGFDMGELGLEARKERGERSFVSREVIVAATLVMV
ncbi:MAU2 chromatid cohesion factor homolog [Striga asiatica]|uniref:MAU2 chromatid cohesion factor homolog n=1 Tax=Striga asiatica TaxID=4170 RepID=A0A5A7PHF7_STRAF|nr:MAU2 chromatid cohesion factor homolog [Striga asiatica]